MEKENIRYLFSRYANQLCTREEYDRFLKLLADAENDKELRALLDELWLEMDQQEQVMEETGPAIQGIKTIRLWPRIAAAASILLFLSIGGYWLLHKTAPVQLASNDVAPFSKQAVLKTGHGKTLVLDSNFKGTLAQYANTNIQKSTGEQIAYSNNSEITDEVIYDTLQVPAGGKPYRLKLADGSAITINVASAVRFPENFRKNNNEVQLMSGEAYFSIVHQMNAILTIKAKDQTILDYGTEFDVNTYNDEPDGRTTLVEGSVKVNNKLLIPGQQAIITNGGLIITKADVEQVTAWLKGYFRFNGEDIQAVMRELARWYNIEVKYDGKPSKEGYHVKISRSRNISDVLKILERTNSVHFKIEGRRITVLSKK